MSFPRSRFALLMAALILAAALPAGAQSLTLESAPGGVVVSGSDPSWVSGFGNVNGLGLGTPGAGVSLIAAGVTGGVLYTTPYSIVVSSGPPAKVSAYVSANFAQPAALELLSCYPAGSCTTAAQYSVLSRSAAAPTPILTGNTSAGTHSASLGLLVRAVSGPGAFAGADTATITLLTYHAVNGQLRDTDTLTLNSPTVNLQTALRLLLSEAGGLPVATGSNFSVSFGEVNGLGIGPGPGLGVSSAAGGVVYHTAYAIEPAFSGFSGASASVRAHVSADFAHPAVLELRDSPDSESFGGISKSAGAPTVLTGTATNGSTLMRHLGLFVSELNGPGAFTGSDNAVLTFTLVVP